MPHIFKDIKENTSIIREEIIRLKTKEVQLLEKKIHDLKCKCHWMRITADSNW